MQVNEGEMLAIIGSSGAGKSTLLHILGGLDKPDSGNILIQNTNLQSLSPQALAMFRNQKLGFVFQFHHLLPEFSAIENVAMPLWINRLGKKEGLTKAAQMLEKVGLGHKITNKPAELSGGEQQRVAIARALINNPSILMADEPTGNLDSVNANSIHELFIDLRTNHKQTIILITHNEDLAKKTDRTLIMKDGRIIEEQVHPLVAL
jgi:lipoprotein-releasing system ATP-binding protein